MAKMQIKIHPFDCFVRVLLSLRTLVFRYSVLAFH
jgi:hypothetical protein